MTWVDWVFIVIPLILILTFTVSVCVSRTQTTFGQGQRVLDWVQQLRDGVFS